MKRPDRHFAWLLALLPTLAVAQDAVEEELELPDMDGWYRVELLIFARRDAAAFGAQEWDPLPAVSYPDAYRHLLDPRLVEQRADAAAAYDSRIDEFGVQHLTVPRPVQGMERVWRPDARLLPPQLDELPLPPPEIVETSGPPAQEEAPVEEGLPVPIAAEDSDGVPDVDTPEAPPEPVPDPPLWALPYQLLPTDALEFRTQARQLRRQGNETLFHAAWWVQLSDDATPITVAVDRASDVLPDAWPALQGTFSLYRSRFIHGAVDLWLNTSGEYLPDSWYLPDAPRSRTTLHARRIDGEEAPSTTETLTLQDLLRADAELMLPSIDDTAAADHPDSGAPADPLAGPLPVKQDVPDWVRDPSLDTANPAADASVDLIDASGPLGPPGSAEDPLPAEAVPPASEYPYRHAIVHRQSARMRGGEIHYLDHPVLGVVLRVTPADRDNPPSADLEETEWRERHGLPVDRFAIPAPADGDPVN